ncbi:MAG: superoxide dismutase [Sporocytophaga sp.]|uniref:superoxide dismutase n=1 Tax=Sporocytophaga sp. TaxID=2231183 RepID=UPI001B2C6DD4|nr:superoxide dismutase [Sporocytophaga sp.]MBO9700125.1 superoxide dismutase [Sporocytophaga sp.]
MKKILLSVLVLFVSTLTFAQFTLPALPYAYEALEPSFDTQTMQIHHDKHHDAYVKNLNKEVTANPSLNGKTIEDICKNVSKYNTAVRNNGGGHYNHSLFWTVLSPKGGAPAGALSEDINKTFGSFDNFKAQFSDSAKTRFGSGWAWLIVGQDGKLKITTTPNQDNPLMDIVKVKGTPVLALDVWEHAYYLKYQNKRPDYITAFWNIVNWDEVNRRYTEAKKK